jgi:uncharacterized protein with PIN domain
VIVVTGSILLVFLRGEPKTAAGLARLTAAEKRVIEPSAVFEAAATLLEEYDVTAEEAFGMILDLLRELDIEIVPLTLEAAFQATKAYPGDAGPIDRSWARGFGHLAIGLREALGFKETLRAKGAWDTQAAP